MSSAMKGLWTHWTPTFGEPRSQVISLSMKPLHCQAKLSGSLKRLQTDFAKFQTESCKSIGSKMAGNLAVQGEAGLYADPALGKDLVNKLNMFQSFKRQISVHMDRVEM